MRQLTIALLVLFCASTAWAEEQADAPPLLELGIAVGGASLPHYMGSDERYLVGAPIPYVIYRGQRMRIDRSGITRKLFGFNSINIDASLGVGLPVRNTNRARAGMPELKFSFEIGPRLNWQIIEEENRKLTLRLPWRGVIDTSGSWLGWVVEPELRFEQQLSEKLQLNLATGALYGSTAYHKHYYDVAPPYATPTRPGYQAGRGLHSFSATVSMRYNISETVNLFSAVRYRNLSAGVITDSPLVKDKNYVAVAAGLAWSFWSSERRGSAD
ncbi:MipA/OmpV family protein [Mariprofundus sp. NF]|uniref:MipA/OmpV family protein n=1 Tax=Mariprofundus sp. NF TaxID=2608716 RepID=UPI0015A3D1C4|nr:MipA/OmpV family protein [Mariprofundus sp. NF]NWF38918.1 MipA/OmpV family protein [Mariprofundus sp. NF]